MYGIVIVVLNLTNSPTLQLTMLAMMIMEIIDDENLTIFCQVIELLVSSHEFSVRYECNGKRRSASVFFLVYLPTSSQLYKFSSHRIAKEREGEISQSSVLSRFGLKIGLAAL